MNEDRELQTSHHNQFNIVELRNLEKNLIRERHDVVFGIHVLKATISLWKFLCIFAALIIVGGAIFSALEYPEKEQKIREAWIEYRRDRKAIMDALLDFTEQNKTAAEDLFLRIQPFSDGVGVEPSVDKKWDFKNAVIFCFTIVTTIGYGNVVPVTEWGQMFTCLYALVGLPVAGLTLKYFAERALYVFTWLSKIGSDKAEDAFHEFDKDDSGQLDKDEFRNAVKLLGFKLTPLEFEKLWTGVDTDGGGTINLEEFREAIENMNIDVTEASQRNQVRVTLIGILFWVIIGSIAFKFTESWPPIKTIYFVFVSLFTIGLGDIEPKTLTGQIILVIWAMFGLGLIAVLLTLVESFLTELKNVRNITSGQGMFRRTAPRPRVGQSIAD